MTESAPAAAFLGQSRARFACVADFVAAVPMTKNASNAT